MQSLELKGLKEEDIILITMASLVSALDSTTPKQVGENNHQEYGWSGDMEEKILQLSFQLTRTKNGTIKKEISEKYSSLIRELFNSDSKNYLDINIISISLRLMFQTRDLIKGKGEYGLFYILFGEWIRLCKELKDDNNVKSIIETICKIVLKSCITIPNDESEEQGYGSWKDMKYIMNYMKYELKYSHKELEESIVFKYIIELIIKRLKIDNIFMNTKNSGNISLLAKWIPREKSNKFGWIAKHIAKALYSEWIIDFSECQEKHKMSVRKAMTHYRKMIAKLNGMIDTVQIKQCNGSWADIDFDKGVTSITLSKQKHAFNYMDKRGNLRGDDDDRLKCKENYKKYIDECSAGTKEIKGARCSLTDLIRDAIEQACRVPQYKDRSLIDTINLQWDKLGEQIGDLGNMIAMVDTSGSMTCDNCQPLHAAIGLGCRIAEKSKLGRRVMTFSQKPEWVNLSSLNTLVEMVDVVKRSNWGMNTNFHAAMKMVLDACIAKNLKPNEVSDLVFVVFSDMQIDLADSTSKSTLNETIQTLFHEGGKKTQHGEPYSAPHILFWNLRSTGGFPALSTDKNISMLSGFNAVLLNTFCEKGMDALAQCTPMSILMEQLDDSRYSWVNPVIEKLATKTFFPESPTSEKSNNSTDSIEDLVNEVINKKLENELEEIPEIVSGIDESKPRGWFDWW